MILVAWTAAFAIYGCLAILVVMIGAWLAISHFTTGTLRLVLQILFALAGLALTSLL